MTAYTEAQAAAIACLHEPLQIIACAGAGKTQVISQRIAAILSQAEVEPRNLIAFTFTEKAAAELKDRIHTVLGRGGDQHTGDRRDVRRHDARLLRSTWSSGSCQRHSSSQCSPRSRLGCSSIATAEKSGLTECPTLSPGTPRLATVPALQALYAGDERASRGRCRREPCLRQACLKSHWDYMKLLYDNAFFDFTEMINLAVQLLEGDPDEDAAVTLVQRHIRDDIRYVVVDEYQDVNPLQERLVRGLTQFGANLCVVGDDDQTIYQWRGSEVSNIITFSERYDGVRQVTLARQLPIERRRCRRRHDRSLN